MRLFDALFLYHLHPFAEHIARALSQYVVSPDAGDVLDEVVLPPASARPDALLKVNVA